MGVVVASLALGIVVISLNEQGGAPYPSALGRPGDVYLVPNVEGPGGGVPPSVSANAVDTARNLLPITQVHEIREPQCDGGFCPVQIVRPRAVVCPYVARELDREPTRDEQRAARQDARCDGLGHAYFYFASRGSDDGQVVVVDPASAGVVANLPPADTDAVAAALRDGKVVVDDARYLTDGRVTLVVDLLGDNGEKKVETATAPAFVMPHPPRAPISMMTEATARSLGLVSFPVATLALTSRVPTVAEQDRLQAALGDEVQVEIARPTGSSNGTFLLVLAIVAAVITVAAAAMATGLTAADSRADLGTLGAVGASPGVRRLLTLSQTGVIAGLGSALGVVAGVGASAAVLFALNQRSVDLWPAPAPYPIHVPWVNVAIALVAVPAVAMLGAGLLTRSRLPIERRR
jgi:putative ABC transport system permease protein